MHPAGRASVLAVALLLLAGCGSSSTHTVTPPAGTTSAQTPGRAEFIAKADAICAKLRQAQAPLQVRAAALEEAGESSARRTALASVMHDVVKKARAADAQIAAIPRPAGSEPTIGKLLAGYSEETTELGKLADAIEAVDGPGIRSARAQLAKAKASDRGLAQGFGLKVCSEPRAH